MTNPRHAPVWLGLLGLAAFLVGCSGTSSPTPNGAPGGFGGPGGPEEQGHFDTESGPFAAGKKVFVASGCFRCHTIDKVRGPVGGTGMPGGRRGPGGGPPMAGGGPPGGPPMAGGPGGPGRGPGMGRSRGPDLGKVGHDPAHTADWFTAYIRNPKATKPDARMPAFGENRINDNDLRALAEYLASLK